MPEPAIVQHPKESPEGLRTMSISHSERIQTLRRLAQEVYAERPELQQAFGESSNPAYWSWVHCYGWKEHAGLRSVLLDIPPRAVYRFSNPSDDWGYLSTSANTHTMLAEALRDQGRDLATVESALDFGCGPGRGLRSLLQYTETMQLFGNDVDGTAIDWCRQEFPCGEFVINEELPPLPWDADSFELIFSVSVFSHLSEKSHRVWLAELERLARPGGHLVLTVHGEHALQRTRTEPVMRDLIEVGEAEMAAGQEAFRTTGFGFMPQPTGHLTTDLYGVTFIDRGYVEREWGRSFDVVDYRVAALDDWQDAVVLRAR